MKAHPLLTKEIVAILCITLLAAVAILKGLDTVIFTAAIAAIAGIAGYSLKSYLPGGLKHLIKRRK